MSDWQTHSHTRIDLLRHGECQGGEIFRGSTDVELSALGWQQMHAAVANRDWDQIISSPLKRCQLFAETLAADRSIPLTIDERWREFNFGIWEGRLRAEVLKESSDQVSQFFSDPESFTPDAGDSYLSVCDRVLAAWEDVLIKYANKRVLIIIHGGIFRTLHAQLTSLPSHAFNTIEVPYACFSRWKHYGDAMRKRPLLSFHNVPANTDNNRDR